MSSVYFVHDRVFFIVLSKPSHATGECHFFEIIAGKKELFLPNNRRATTSSRQFNNPVVILGGPLCGNCFGLANASTVRTPKPCPFIFRLYRHSRTYGETKDDPPSHKNLKQISHKFFTASTNHWREASLPAAMANWKPDWCSAADHSRGRPYCKCAVPP